MAYEREVLDGTMPTRLASVHQELLRWLADKPNLYDDECLQHQRLIDEQAGCAIYVLQGILMNDGVSLAWVREREIVVFDAWNDGARQAFNPLMFIRSIRLSEGVGLSQHEVQQLIELAVRAYEQLWNRSPHMAAPALDFSKADWEIWT